MAIPQIIIDADQIPPREHDLVSMARWLSGARYGAVPVAPNECFGPLGSWPFTCEAPADFTDTKEDTAEIEYIEGHQAIVYAKVTCNRVSGVEEVDDLVLRAYQLGHSKALEKFVVDLLPALGAPAPTPFTSVKAALASLEGLIMRTINGRGVIHMTPEHASQLGSTLVNWGDHLSTRLGTPVVIGNYYPEASAAPAGSLPMFATGIPRISGGTEPRITVSNFDPESNEYTHLVEGAHGIHMGCPPEGWPVVYANTYSENGTGTIPEDGWPFPGTGG